MNGKFFGNAETNEREILKAEFSKFIKVSSHIVRELVIEQVEPDESGIIYVQSMLNITHSLGILSDDNRNTAYSGELDFEEIVSMLLKIFITNYSIFDEIEQCDRVSLSVAQRNYEALQKYIDSEIEGTFTEVTPDTNSKKEDNLQMRQRLEAHITNILLILRSQSHERNDKDYSTLLEFVDLLLNLGIIDLDDSDRIFESNDIDTELYNILKHKIFGIYIPKNHHHFKIFEEFEQKYKTRVIHGFRNMIASTTLANLDKDVNPRLIDSILEAFNLNSDNFDRDKLIILLTEGGFIGEKDKNYFATMTSLNDFLAFMSLVVIPKIITTSNLSYEQENALSISIEAFRATDGQNYFTHFGKSQEELKEGLQEVEVVLMYGRLLIENLMHTNGEFLAFSDLNSIINLLEKNIDGKSHYLLVLGKTFNDIKREQQPFHKAIQILGILVCDILDINHPLFEDASELLLCNIRDGRKHATVLRMIQTKSLSNNPTSP